MREDASSLLFAEVGLVLGILGLCKGYVEGYVEGYVCIRDMRRQVFGF